MARVAATVLAVLLVVGAVSACCAWELSMKGETEWRYRYWTRTGNKDIFGSMGGTVNLGLNHLQTFPTDCNHQPRLGHLRGIGG